MLKRFIKEQQEDFQTYFKGHFNEEKVAFLIDELRLGDLEIISVFEALTHKSLFNEVRHWPFPSSERLEFLGDAVLELWCSMRLFSSFKDLNEGQLSRFRGALVNEETLGQWGRYLEIDQLIILGKGEREKGLAQSDGFVSDTFEALVGASLVCSGWNKSYSLLNHWEELFNKRSDQELVSQSRLDVFDPKSRLQEKTMAMFKILPQYESCSLGDAFRISLKVKGQTLLSLISPSKRKGERKLAQQALEENLLEKIEREEQQQ